MSELDDPMLPSGATLVIAPGAPRRIMKARIVGILAHGIPDMLDCVTLEERQEAIGKLADEIIEELP